MDARRLEKLPCGHWTPENVVYRRQTLLWIQTLDASKISQWMLDAYQNTPQDARRQTYSPQCFLLFFIFFFDIFQIRQVKFCWYLITEICICLAHIILS